MPLPLFNSDPNQDQSLPVATGNDATGLPLQRVYITPPQADVPEGPIDNYSSGTTDVTDTKESILDKLLGTNGQDRYQLWPEKLVRDALAAPHDAMNTTTPVTSEDLIKPALDVSAMAGTGGLAGAGEDAGAATLGAGPFLRPALKYEGKIYKAPMGGQHMDAIPKDLQPEFTRQAMNGEDISNFDFGFMNHKGQFLDREKALQYAIDNGLLSPHDAKFGALTSTMQLSADSAKEAAALDAVSKQPFYSAAEKAVNDIPQAKMTGDQWLGTLANKPGVKSEELQYTGLNDFLKSKGGSPVTKEEVQGHLQNNKVELGEVDKGGHKNWTQADSDRLDELENLRHNITDEQEVERQALISRENNATREEGLNGGTPTVTKYHSYQLPGGENYREKLLTLPTGTQKYNEFIKEIRAKHGEGGLNNLPLSEAERKTYETRLAGAEKDEDVSPYKSSHWDEPNIIAHTRMNDRMIDGKKSLHMEEIQSDWHQQGRDKGYRGTQEKELADLIKQRSEVHEKLRKAAQDDSPEFDKLSLEKKAIQAKIDKIGVTDVGVPDAPFKKTWHELALKRMIREAAEKGYDRLSWTPGEAQAARYDLSKSVDSLHYDPKTNTVKGFKDGKPVVTQEATADKLPDIVGKEAAKKLLETKPEINKIYERYDTSSEPSLVHSLSGQQLKIGGEGMKGFYDKIIPKALEKISGEKVKTAQVETNRGFKEKLSVYDKQGHHVKDFDNMTDARAYLGDPSNGLPGGTIKGNKEIKPITAPVHYIDMTPALKAKALKGFPLFSSTHFAPAIEAYSNGKKK